ncbi:hypothetical protein [Exiguobacterium algae]|uniref:hypothetical protein n=1 Tax=Exiguobacterium algae TaxID=2751250 RepID=UPI001BEC08CF|nr:hypothetical protein [Exiguobacterium algae]
MIKFINQLLGKQSKKDCCDVLIQEIEERPQGSCCRADEDQSEWVEKGHPIE